MRVLLAVLLIGIAGCGGGDNSPDDVAAPSSLANSPVKPENTAAGVAKVAAPASTPAVTDLVATLETLRIKQDDQGNDVELEFFSKNKFTDARLAHLKGLVPL